MKVKPNKRGTIEKRLRFAHAEQKGISLELAYRLAAWVEFVAAKTKQPALVLDITSGYRDTAYQKMLFDQNIDQYPPKGNGKVAKAGRSWHEARCAADVGGTFFKPYLINGDYNKTYLKQELYQIGLYMPLNLVDNRDGIHEWWHLQLIETRTWTNADTRKAFLDWDDPFYQNAAMSVFEFQAFRNLVQDGVAGPKTKAQALIVKASPMYKASKIKQVVDKILA